MLNYALVNHQNAVRVIDFRDPVLRSLTRETIEDLLEEEGLLEALSMADIENSAFGQLKVHENDALLEAISTTRARVAQTMRAFIRALNQKLGGTGITAGNDTAGDADDGSKTIGGANVGRTRRISGFAVMPAIIPLSDGQTVTVMFHSPSGDQGKIMPGDVLVAFQFLLNKKDVTHVVAPMGGRDMSLSQVTMTLSNIIERNSAKFQRNQKRQERMKAELLSTQQELTSSTEQERELQTSLQVNQSETDALQSQLTSVQNAIEGQQDYNADLRTRIEALKEKAKNKLASGSEDASKSDSELPSASVPLSSIQTGAMWPTLKKAAVSGADAVWYTQSNAFDIKASATLSLNGSTPSEGALRLYEQFKAAKEAGYEFTHFRISGLQGIYVFVKDGQVLTKAGAQALVPASSTKGQADNDPAPLASDDDDSKMGRYRYALVNRPAGIGAVPPGQAGVLPRPPESDPYYEYARNGIVTYNTPLSDEQISQFQLLYLPTESEYPDLAKRFASLRMAEYAAQFVEMATADAGTFEKTVRVQFRKSMPTIAYPLGAAEKIFIGEVVNALRDIATVSSDENEATKSNEVDEAANKAIEYLKTVIAMSSNDMQEIRVARGSVREAIAALQSAGRFDENEDLVNQAAQKLSDLLVAIQRAGAAGVTP